MAAVDHPWLAAEVARMVPFDVTPSLGQFCCDSLFALVSSRITIVGKIPSSDLHRLAMKVRRMKPRFGLLLLLVTASGMGSLHSRAETAVQSDFHVTLLGTGIPVPDPDRFGPSTLVEAGAQKLLFDAGRGATIRLFQLHVSLSRVGPLFLTHFHSDHTSGIPDIWLSGWLGGPWARRTSPFRVIGPTGTKELMLHLEEAYKADIKIRMADEHYPAEGIRVLVDEFSGGRLVYEKDGVRVTAFEVDHGDLIKPAYGYRVDYNGHSVVISGDTRFNTNVIKFGTGADLLIHEVAAVKPELLKDPQVQRVMAHHTSPQDAGKVFSQVGPKLAVYTHLVLLNRPTIPAVTSKELVAQTRQTYAGPLVVGEDLMSFAISDSGVEIVPASTARSRVGSP
jgi:ribonuclease Z